VLEVHETEVEAVDGLGSFLRQLGADRLRVLEARDQMAAEATVVRDQLLARVDLLGVLVHLGEIGLRVEDGLGRHLEVERDCARGSRDRSPAALSRRSPRVP
jgi:hypothetical protein